jgi:hypothetical protein
MVDHKAGDLVLIQESSDVGQLVRFGQWLNGDGFHDFEHVAVYDGKGGVYEETPRDGAEHNPFRPAKTCQLFWSTDIILLNDTQRAGIIASCEKYVEAHVGYSFADYFAIAAHRLHIPAPHLKAYIKSSGHMICSQFVDQVLFENNYHLFNDGRWQGDVTPGDIYNRLLEIQDVIKRSTVTDFDC